MSDTGSEIILYRAPDGSAAVELRARGGSVWLSQAEIAQLYGTSVSNVNHIIARIVADGELDEATIDAESIVRQEGVRQVSRQVRVYHLDMVLAVGYRVSTPRAVQFRQWATTVLKEYLIKGFALDDHRLASPGRVDYFDELLQRIRLIRASEKRFSQKVRDIFATSADYDGTTEAAKKFFTTIQNKLIRGCVDRGVEREVSAVVAGKADDEMHTGCLLEEDNAARCHHRSLGARLPIRAPS